jgi:uncharacterized phage infection (PIP) family protein YhgE
MTQLEDDLAELSRTVPQLADEIAKVLDHATLVRKELQHIDEELKREVPITREMVAHPFPPNLDLARLFHEFDQQLQGSLHEIEGAWKVAHGELEKSRDGVKSATDRLQASAAALGQTMTEMKTSVDEASQAGQVNLDTLEGLSHDGQARLHAAATSITEEVAALHALLDHVRQSMADSAQAVLARATQLASEATQHSSDLVADLEHRRDSLHDQDQTVAEHTLEGVEQVIEDGLTPRLNEAVDHGVHEPGTAVQHELEGLAHTAGEAESGLDHGHHDWKDAVGRLESTAEPIPHALQEIHEAAERMRHQ